MKPRPSGDPAAAPSRLRPGDRDFASRTGRAFYGQVIFQDEAPMAPDRSPADAVTAATPETPSSPAPKGRP